MNELIIAPSVLSLDFANASEQLERLMESDAKWLHFDVMDGHFVPNITFGTDVLRGFKKKTNLYMDVHLMISDPEKYVSSFIKNGADMITFHYEALANIDDCIALCQKIKAANCQCGITIKPNTDVHVLDAVLNYVDMVLIMSVEPGFGGQKFQASSLDKIRYLDHWRKQNNAQMRIQIDGGINQETALLAISAGCDTLVAGSYVFNQDIVAGVKSLLCLKK